MELTTEHIARICHEANRAYCVALGDTSQPSWDDAPEWQKTSAIEGVRHSVRSGLGGDVGRASHDSWMEHKLRDGWRYGPVKNPDTKEHPCLLPYAVLPPEQKKKDELFVFICAAFRDLFPSQEQKIMAEQGY